MSADVSAPCLNAMDVAALTQRQVAQLLAEASPQDLHALDQDWRFWARRAQLPPPGEWTTWLLLGGRGSGKTRAGAEFIRAQVECGQARRIALIGPTLESACAVMVEGPSGLLNLAGESPIFEPSLNRLTWPDGAQAFVFSARDPVRFRGPQFDCAWGDEACYWPDLNGVLATLRLGLRLGRRPRLVLTSTPRRSPALRALIDDPGTVVGVAPTCDNRAALAEDFVASAVRRLGDGAAARQELFGEVDWSPAGPLWDHAALLAARVDQAPPLDRIVVAVDPPASSGPRADACGLIAAGIVGAGETSRAYVLADASVACAAPHVWARAAVALAVRVGAGRIVAEANMGGDMVRAVLAAAGSPVSVHLVRATLSKRERAAPIALFYRAGRVFHVDRFAALEDEMVTFGAADGGARSPDRMDALVWALSDLFSHAREPRLSRL